MRHLWRVIEGQCEYNEKIVQDADQLRFFEGLAEAIPQFCIQLTVAIGGFLGEGTTAERKVVFPDGWGKFSVKVQ